MSIKITIKSRKLGREVTFVARDASGYTFVDPDGATWGRQLFDRDGNALIARSEKELRAIARRWISQRAAA